MSQIKLADIPLEVQDQYQDHGNPTAKRMVDILKRINFPGRDKVIFSCKNNWLGMGLELSMRVEIVDSDNGSLSDLGHVRSIREDMSDDELAREIFIMLAQFHIHEFAENFRFNGDILFHPHREGRNERMFAAVNELAQFDKPPKPKKEDNFFQYVVSFDVESMRPLKRFKATPIPVVTEVVETPPDFAKLKFGSAEQVDALNKRKEKQKKAHSQFMPKDWRDKKRAA